ncbi:MAG: RNA ligase family protein [Patescibacteria group bacterium]
MRKFPKIPLYYDVITRVREVHDFVDKVDGKAIFDHTSPYPVMTFVGRTKLHGVNCGFGLETISDKLIIQSRDKELDINSTSQALHGFEGFCNQRQDALKQILSQYQYTEYIRVFGEFCGGHIQGKVAISQLPKMFVIFAVEYDGKFFFEDLPSSIESDIYSIEACTTKFEVKIDFEHPQKAQQLLIQATDQVVKNCPFSNQLGSVDGAGEGLVWICKDVLDRGIPFRFKTKNADLNAFKGRTSADYDQTKVDNLDDFCLLTLTEARINQGKQHLEQSGLRVEEINLGYFLAWIVNDILTEHKNVLEENQISEKSAKKAIKQKAIQLFKDSLI